MSRSPLGKLIESQEAKINEKADKSDLECLQADVQLLTSRLDAQSRTLQELEEMVYLGADLPCSCDDPNPRLKQVLSKDETVSLFYQLVHPDFQIKCPCGISGPRCKTPGDALDGWLGLIHSSKKGR